MTGSGLTLALTCAMTRGHDVHYAIFALQTLAARHREFVACQQEAVQILRSDPQNRFRQHNILKLRGVPAAKGSTACASNDFASAMTSTIGTSSSKPAACAAKIRTGKLSPFSRRAPENVLT
jgi:hypothetical protein